jgi:hypothetical protein
VGGHIIDMELRNISDLITVELSSGFGIALFLVIAIVYTIGQYFISPFSKRMTKVARGKNRYILLATKE